MPGYNKFRQACGLRALGSWSEKPAEYDTDYWAKLKDVYEKVDDIDLFVGAIAEAPVRGGVLGPTFACLIAEQFKRLKQGDRFFYTHVNANGLSAVAKQVLSALMHFGENNFLTIFHPSTGSSSEDTRGCVVRRDRDWESSEMGDFATKPRIQSLQVSNHI